jgi:hypothetical protein
MLMLMLETPTLREHIVPLTDGTVLGGRRLILLIFLIFRGFGIGIGTLSLVRDRIFFSLCSINTLRFNTLKIRHGNA